MHQADHKTKNKCNLHFCTSTQTLFKLSWYKSHTFKLCNLHYLEQSMSTLHVRTASDTCQCHSSKMPTRCQDEGT
ncbi:hypothetical protein NDU88_004041, partial [Pleurodeles waltl]